MCEYSYGCHACQPGLSVVEYWLNGTEIWVGDIGSFIFGRKGRNRRAQAKTVAGNDCHHWSLAERCRGGVYYGHARLRSSNLVCLRFTRQECFTDFEGARMTFLHDVSNSTLAEQDRRRKQGTSETESLVLDVSKQISHVLLAIFRSPRREPTGPASPGS